MDITTGTVLEFKQSSNIQTEEVLTPLVLLTIDELIESNLKFKINNNNLQKKLVEMQIQINDLKQEVENLKFIYKHHL